MNSNKFLEKLKPMSSKGVALAENQSNVLWLQRSYSAPRTISDSTANKLLSPAGGTLLVM